MSRYLFLRLLTPSVNVATFIGMNRLKRDKRIQVIAALCEGNSIASTVRMTGVSKPTILRLLLDVGRACVNHEDQELRFLSCAHVQADELWGFCHSKDQNIRPENVGKGGHGSVWTWIALCADSKLIISWLMGDRDAAHAHAFMHDLASRLVARPQLTTDALWAYAPAVLDAFDRLGVDYGQLRKVFGSEHQDQIRYSPAQCIGCKKRAIYGRPHAAHVSTSYVERVNLTIRMSQRRWTRLTNAHSKSFRHMEAAFAVHTFWYNWCRPHMSLDGFTPAMAADVADRVWTHSDLVELLEDQEAADRLNR